MDQPITVQLTRPEAETVVSELDPLGHWVEEAVGVFLDLNAALDALPEDEKREYEEAQQSVVDARRSANRTEGHIWIG